MTEPIRITDELLRLALTPPDDGADFGLDVSIREALDRTEQRRYWWTPLVRWFGPLGPSRQVRVVGVLVALLGLLLAIAATVGTRPPPLLADGSMFHGGPARTGEMAGPGPVAGAEIVWSVSLAGPLRNSMPALVGGRLYVADGRGNVAVFDAATGAAGWTRSLPKPATSPAIAAGVLVVSAGDGVYGLDAATGTVRWHLPAAAPVESAPAIDHATVYVGLPDGSLTAVDLQTGTVRWRTSIGGAITRAPSVADGLVFAGGEGGHVAAIRAVDGTFAWRAEIGPGNVGTTAVRDGVVYATSGLDAEAPHVLFAISESSGAELWRFSAPGDRELYVGAIAERLVYAVGLDGHVYALRDGTVVWAFDARAPIGSVASLTGGLLYISASSGQVFALDALSGAKRWTVQLEGDAGPGIPADGRLYLGTDVGVLVALAEPAP